MSSYYTNIEGTLETGKTARADDIHLIQSSVREMIKNVIIDLCGDAFILGESENAFKLYAASPQKVYDKTTETSKYIYIDQTNLNYNDDVYWVSFYDRYFRQPIEIKKSSIESICVDMINDTNITTTVYAELRDSNFELVKEANAVLAPTPGDSFQEVEFHFNEEHLQVGLYYFVIRPVDISAADLATDNKDDYIYTTSDTKYGAMPQEYSQNTLYNGILDTIMPEHFCIRYDADGSYNHGLEASYDGSIYLQAKYLDETLVEGDNLDEEEYNPDLYFKEIYSSGNVYVVDTECTAVIQGERVNPTDTHVSISAPNDKGNRIDVISLNKDGELIVTKGVVFTDNEEKQYPVSPAGNLDIAYITNFIASANKVPVIEQDDTTNFIRQRDVLERLRRVEKLVNYQKENNAPIRFIYNCVVDPILANNGVDDDAEIRGEGTYNIGTYTDSNGNTVATDSTMLNYAWSIIKNHYTYNVETQTTENGKITVWDAYTTPKKDKQTYTTSTKGLYHYHAEVYDHSTTKAQPVKNLELTVQIKKGGTLKHNQKYTTNNKGIINFSLTSLKLSNGTYSVYTIYGSNKIKSKLIVNKKENLKFKENTHSITVSLPKVSGVSVTNSLPEGVFAGNDSFYTDNVEVDTEKGEVRIKKISNLTESYDINDGKALLKDTKGYTSSERVYTIKQAKSSSTFPAINVVFDREIYIKSITPYISGFKNITSFGILIFKNDVIKKTVNSRKDYKNAKKKTYNKTIGAGKVDKNNYDDANFPTLYKSKYVSLKDLVKKSGNYQVLKNQVTFDNVNLDLEAGTYTIMICPKLKSGAKSGEIKIKQYHTKNDAVVYGMNTNIHGSSKLSKVYFDNLHVYDESWDIAIKHKTYKYYDKGILISKPINTGISFSACTITKNFIQPKNCDIKLYVSNNGGTTWVYAKNNHVKFESSNSSFRWKLEMTSNNIATPKLKFNNTRKSAISFSLATAASYVEYEDYHRCYETPLMNANFITRQQTRSVTTNPFTAWEFARVFMEDEEFNSKIDILISYSDDDYTTHVGASKSNWKPGIFFSTVFADLTLNDFKQESIDYDNYDGNVEYDEYNYRFALDSSEIVHYSGGLALASPNDASTDNPDVGIYYGDINSPEATNMSNYFSYQYIDDKASPYVYYGNDGDSTKKYAGMHISNGPYVKATYQKHSSITEDYTSDDTIIGIRFNDGLEINDNVTHLTIGLIAHAIDRGTNREIVNNDTSTGDGDTVSSTSTIQTYFPAGTFKIALSLGRNGEIDATSNSAGKEIIINKPLISDTYTEIDISLFDDLNNNSFDLDDFEGYSVSSINSIAIKAVDPTQNPMTLTQENDSVIDADFIGIGRVTTGSYNMRPYVPYTHSGSYKRLQWENIISNETDKKKAAAFAMYSLGRVDANTTSYSKVFYPIDNAKDINNANTSYRLINSNTETIDGDMPINKNSSGTDILQVWGSNGTHRRKGKSASYKLAWGQSANQSYIERNENQISTYLYKGKENNKDTWTKYVTEDTGNQILFHLPSGVTGKLFKITTKIPYTIYDLIDIEYYIFSQYWKSTDSDKPSNPDTTGRFNVHKHSTTNDIIWTDGSFSKGELYIDLYDTEDTTGKPMESFALPSWGRVATRSEVNNKVVHAWFKKRSSKTTVRAIVLRRENPRNFEKSDIKPIKLLLNDILFFNTEQEAALGPQMQMRIYPNNIDNMTNTKIRKIGGVYRL